MVHYVINSFVWVDAAQDDVRGFDGCLLKGFKWGLFKKQAKEMDTNL